MNCSSFALSCTSKALHNGLSSTHLPFFGSPGATQATYFSCVFTCSLHALLLVFDRCVASPCAQSLHIQLGVAHRAQPNAVLEKVFTSITKVGPHSVIFTYSRWRRLFSVNGLRTASEFWGEALLGSDAFKGFPPRFWKSKR